jgi:subtilisin-like proprotein convertase family protein
MFSQGQTDIVDSYINILQNQFKPNTVSCGNTDPNFIITAITEDTVFSCPSVGEDAVFEFDFTTYNGFSSLVDFSATGQPAGSSVTFSPASTNVDTTVTMTVSDIANTAQGSYTINVNAATSGFGNSVSQTITFNLSNNCTSIQCFTFSSEENLATPIPDGIDANGTTDSYGERILVPLTIPEYASISSLSVNVDVSHTYINDLLIAVFHPDLETYSILWGRDCAGEDGLDVTFIDGAGTIVCEDPTVGTFSPFQPLSIFNGMTTVVTAENVAEDWNTNDWALYISDGYIEDTGVLNDWSIEICVEAALSSGESDITVNDITVYPNPSSGVFNVEINSLNISDIKISIYNLLGSVVFENNFDNSFNFNEAIDLSSVESGVYLMNVTIGNKKVTKKIIIN